MSDPRFVSWCGNRKVEETLVKLHEGHPSTHGLRHLKKKEDYKRILTEFRQVKGYSDRDK